MFPFAPCCTCKCCFVVVFRIAGTSVKEKLEKGKGKRGEKRRAEKREKESERNEGQISFF